MAWFGKEVKINIDATNAKGVEKEIEQFAQALERLYDKVGFPQTMDILSESQKTLHSKKDKILVED